MAENKFRELPFMAVGSAIGKLINAVEVLKIVKPSLYEINKIVGVLY
jgi:hypothetical protein